MQAAIEAYLGHLKGERDASAHTLRNYRVDLTQFAAYLRGRSGGGSTPVPRPSTSLPFEVFSPGSTATSWRGVAWLGSWPRSGRSFGFSAAEVS